MFKPTLLVDFDCTITLSRGYNSPPNNEAVEALKKLHEKYNIVIYSCRANCSVAGSGEYVLLEDYLKKYDIPYDSIETEKPIFYRLIDDRCINPDQTSWSNILKELL